MSYKSSQTEIRPPRLFWTIVQNWARIDHYKKGYCWNTELYCPVCYAKMSRWTSANFILATHFVPSWEKNPKPHWNNHWTKPNTGSLVCDALSCKNIRHWACCFPQQIYEHCFDTKIRGFSNFKTHIRHIIMKSILNVKILFFLTYI